jgi:Domain of unknown function (DUF4386)
MTATTSQKIIGTCFILAIFAYGFGNFAIESVTAQENYLQNIQSQSNQLVFGALLMLLNSIFVATIGFLLLPILKPHSEIVAYTQFSARLMEAVLLVVGIIFLLLQIPITKVLSEQNDPNNYLVWRNFLLNGNYYAYQLAMIVLGLNGILFCTLFLRKKLTNSLLAVLGIVGYAGLFVGAIAELFDYPIGIMCAIPGGIFELIFGFTMIFKGFNSNNKNH